MEDKDVSALKSKIEKVDHVSKVIWYDSFADLSVPKDMLPESLYDAFNNDEKNATMMAIIFDDTTSADGTMDAIEEIRSISNKQCFLSGMSAVVVDTKKLSEKETPIYVLIAVILSSIILAITMDSIMIPVLFLASIGMAIVYNLGSNILMGQVSYITKALAAVLQLGVTMDYSIFLWHSYKAQQKEYTDKKEAMAHAIAETISSVVGSSITTVAGFVALCFMSFTLGLDLGIVMAKGVVLGVIACVTILPSLDMRMDNRQPKTAKDIVNDYSEAELFRILKDYGEERYAKSIAYHICKYRENKVIETTEELNDIIRGSIPAKARNGQGHPSKQTFQAIRIELNRELDVLRDSIDGMIASLNPGGRLCIITFHSLEDRIVKLAFRKNENPCICPPNFPVCTCGRKPLGKVITRKPIIPGERELEENSRSKSSKLRVFEAI